MIFSKIYDKALLVISIIAIMPFVILAVLIVAIGYPLHLIKKSIFSRQNNFGKI